MGKRSEKQTNVDELKHIIGAALLNYIKYGFTTASLIQLYKESEVRVALKEMLSAVKKEMKKPTEKFK